VSISGVNPLALQGLASGMDTEGIIKEITKAKQARLDALKAQKEDLEFRKATLREFNTQVLALQKTVFDLKLDSTFKVKNVTSSNEGVVTATAQAAASAGQHTVKVNQLAQAARVVSNVFTPRLSASPPNTAGITGLVGMLTATPAYLLGDVCEGAVEGKIGANIGTGSNTLKVTVDGTEVNVTLAGAVADVTSLSAVAGDLELKINDAINRARGTSNVTYVVALCTSGAGASNDKIYLINYFDGAEHSISVDSASPAAAALGFADPSKVTAVTGTDPAGGEHNITIYDATRAEILGTELTAPVDFDTGGPYSLNIRLNSTDYTVNLSGVYNDLDALAADIEAQLPAGLIDVSNQSGKITFAARTGDNTLTITNIDGDPCALLGLAGGVTATGTNARAVDIFTPAAGAAVVTVVEDSTDEDTDSNLAGLLKAINGAARDAGHTTDGGGPLINGVIFDGTLTAGTALVRTGSGNELNTNIATAATYTGAVDIAATTLTVTDALSTAGFKTAPGAGTNGTFTINGKTITIADYTKETVNDILAKINASGAGVTASYDAVNDRFTLTANTPGAGQNIVVGSGTDTSNFLTIAGFNGAEATFTAGTNAGAVDPGKAMISGGFSLIPTSGVITINDVPIYINASTDSLNDVIEKINTSAAGVVAAYNAASDTFSLVSTSTDAGRDVISLGSPSDTSNFFYATKLVYPPDIESDGTPTVLNTRIQVGQPGQRALFQVDGVSYNRKSNTVTDVLNGVTMTLNAAQLASGAPATLNITADTSQVLEKIKSFIVEYNKTVEMASPLAISKDEREKYMPVLTEKQIQTMTFAQIEEYNARREALLKRDVLRKDTSVRSFYENLRRLITTSVSGVDSAYNTLRQIGIGTGDIGASWGSNPHGMLLTVSTDAEAIKTALSENATFMSLLEANPDEIARLFTQLTDATLTLAGTADAGSVTLPGDVKVRVGNGIAATEILLAAGTYTGSKLADTLNTNLRGAGISDLTFSLNPANKMQVVSSVDAEDQPNGRAVVDLTDITGGLFSTVLGLTPGYHTGPTVFSLTGVSRRVENYCKNHTQSGGILHNKIKSYGDIDREIRFVNDRISDLEERMKKEQQRLWRTFTYLETYMSNANTQSQWLSQKIAALNSMGAGGS